MDALSALHHRVSVNILDDPAPTQDQLDQIIRAGLRACDHRNLRPWKFLTISGESRKAFGELMANVMSEQSSEKLDDAFKEKIASKPLRAPLIIVVVASIKEHPKVPKLEQVMSAAASAQMMMTAAHALGVGAIWRSGSIMFERAMNAGLGLKQEDQIVGFLYLGTAVVTKSVPELDPLDFVEQWPTT